MVYRRTAAASERDARTRTTILVAARDVVRESGLTGAAIAAVAARAGVAVGTVYRHFPSRDELITEVVRETCDRELAEVAAVVRSDGPPADRLVAAVELFATRALASGRLAYSMIAEPTTEAAEVLRLVIRAELAKLFASIVADGVATGAFERQDPATSGTALVGAVSEVLIGPLARQPLSGDERSEVLEHLTQFAMRAVGVRSPATLEVAR
ncbi:MAG TPA: TetR/AcrR family transcriptional regulator [Ilumatobacteraceae bacterium]|nr:TetR/AcrR family transcriptional regulator [Ilumatobacteraceae bacterium]